MGKNSQHHLSLVKCKLKQQWDNTTYLLEWPKSKNINNTSICKDAEQQKTLFITGGDTKCYNEFRIWFNSFSERWT